MTREAVERLLRERLEYALEEPLLQAFIREGKYKRVRIDEILIRIGDPLDFIPILLSGSLRVMREDEEGREILLYYIEQGETCAVTLKCCGKGTRSKVTVLAEEESLLYMLPVRFMDQWLGEYASWRNFVIDSYDTRMQEMIMAIDALAFDNLESRLKKYLMNKVWVSHNRTLSISHQRIAQDLNSSRVVITRLMKKLEQEGVLVQKRNEVRLLEELTLN